MDQVHFNGSVPEAYLKYLQPLLFDPFSPLFASRVCSSKPARVLELACGTGSLTVELAARCSVEIVATDLQASMVELAEREFWHPSGVRGTEAWKQAETKNISQTDEGRGVALPPATNPKQRITFDVADAQRLPYQDATFDAIACQFGYMFFPDKPRALSEAHRVLKTGGQLHLLIWEPLEINDIARIAHDVIVPFLPEGTPRPFAGPFGFSDKETLALLLSEAGFTEIKFESIKVSEKLPMPEDAARAFCRGTPISQDLGDRTDEAERMLAQAYAQNFTGMEEHSLYALSVSGSRNSV